MWVIYPWKFGTPAPQNDIPLGNDATCTLFAMNYQILTTTHIAIFPDNILLVESYNYLEIIIDGC